MATGTDGTVRPRLLLHLRCLRASWRAQFLHLSAWWACLCSMLPHHKKIVCTYGSLWFPGGRVSLGTWKDVSCPPCLFAPPGAMLLACTGLLLVSFIPSLTVFSPSSTCFPINSLPSTYIQTYLPATPKLPLSLKISLPPMLFFFLC